MIEETKNLESFKIRLADKNWAEDEQKRVRDKRGKKPTQAELFQLMRRAYSESAILEDRASAEYYPYADANRELHDKLERILTSGDQGTIAAVVPNIEIFFERLQPRAKRRAGGK